MQLEKTQAVMQERKLEYKYVEEDGCGSIDFEHRGLHYHIWEYPDDAGHAIGVDTNLFHAGHSDDIEGDYEAVLIEELRKDF